MDESERLRGRAVALRSLADALCQVPLDIGALAGPDTWQGPGPEQCRSSLATHRAVLASAAAELRVSATRLDEQADHLDAMAAAAAVAAGPLPLVRP